MTKTELSQVLNVSINTIERKFKTLQNNYKKKGIIIEKKGKGENSKYFLIYEKDFPSIFELNNNFYFNENMIQLTDFALLISIALTIEDKTFNHITFQEFLRFLEIKPNSKNIKILKETLEFLDEKQFIVYKEDKSKKDFFIASWSMKSKLQYKTQLNVLSEFRKITESLNKPKNYTILFFKTWIGIYLINNEIITIDEFCRRFNITKYYFNVCKEILQNRNLIKYSKVINNHSIIGSIYHINGLTSLSKNLELLEEN